jgi:predicted Zn-dependent protease
VGGARAQVLRTVEDERKAGEEAAKQVEEQMGLYEASATEAYVRAIGERLVSKLGPTPYSFTFQIVDQFEPNAFAVPGGHVYISRGLLLLANSEDEIAGVLGYEISHVTERHSGRQSRKAILPGVLSVPGAVVGSVVGEDVGALINAPITTIGKVSLAKYSRGQEREADELGMALAAKAGYEPLALATILVQLEREVEALTGEQNKGSFFDSHPTTPKRVKGIEKGATRLTAAPQPAIAADKRDLLTRLDGLHFGVNPAQGLFREKQFLHPDMGFTITFPEGWQTVNNPTVVGAIAPELNALATLGIFWGSHRSLEGR